VHEPNHLPACLSLCVYVSGLWKENDLSYQHQSWYTYTLWQKLSMHWLRGQKVKVKGQELWSVLPSWVCMSIWLLRFLLPTKIRVILHLWSTHEKIATDAIFRLQSLWSYCKVTIIWALQSGTSTEGMSRRGQEPYVRTTEGPTWGSEGAMWAPQWGPGQSPALAASNFFSIYR